MREAELRSWMQAQGLSAGTISTQMSKIRKLDRVFGDLDLLEATDGLDALEAKLKAKRDLPDGLGSGNELDHLPTSLRYYRKFLAADDATGNRRAHAALIARLSAADIEAAM